jgi:hypothetical protein
MEKGHAGSGAGSSLSPQLWLPSMLIEESVMKPEVAG